MANYFPKGSTLYEKMQEADRKLDAELAEADILSDQYMAFIQDELMEGSDG